MTRTEQRKEQEKQFHDRLRTDAFGQRWSLDLEENIQSDPLWDNMKYYAIERRSRKTVLTWFQEQTPGKQVLDYCCGNGADGLYIAQQKAQEVVGIDISEVSIRNCSGMAQDLNLSNIRFEVMDAEEMTFPDNYFDIVTEYGALHHLNLDRAYGEMARVLKPDGQAICVEALGHNFFINFYRRKTPGLRTAWEVEHILKKPNIFGAQRYFQEVKILGIYHLATIAAVPFRHTRAFPVILGALETIDTFLLKMPFLKWWAWQIVFVLAKPRVGEHRDQANS
jgi:ubiquinone/menaquinone biosynthesis C-methylase UbiE